MSPGSTDFTEWIKTYSTQINGELGTSSNVAAFGDASHTSETIVGIIAILLEARFVYYDDLQKTPLSERGELEVPHIDMDRFYYLRKDLIKLKGMIPSVSASDPCAFNFDLDTTEGGFD